MIKKLPSGRWQVDIQPGGRGQKRVRKSFDAKADAQRFERWVMSRKDAGEEWNPKKDKRTLLELIDLWYLHHGHALKDGESRKRKLIAICEKLGYPKGAKVTSGDFAAYRLVRIQEGMSPNTLNHEQAYLTAVYNELIRQGLWNGDNPLAKLRRLKIDQTELAFLDQEQITRLLDECKASSNPSVYYVAILALSTGARWSEAESVTQANFTPYRVTYNATKSGKSRSVPLSKEIYNQFIEELPFQSCYSAFRSALERAEITLPKGQLTHICRHTFASHFVMNGGHILTLQKVLGHSDLKLTMRYAHLAPDFLMEVTKKCPKIELR
ncbi:tyrosine-type recombinase/integrase [Marinobacter salarius]|uniref:phage integrase n=1 Tax=Marinobacter salarius TaxID=1420917 RepID=UPI001D194056|nr:tyrosine-type recombinase/integrase [Marinobacter salarius]MCC4284377.1 tyrosine-type recombinase/integrase [Marinobacter salarius]